MSLSAREQRILSEIERDLTAAEPLLGRALASMRLGLWPRMVIGTPGRPRGSTARRGANRGPAVAMISAAVVIGLAAGIAVLSTGLMLDILAMVIGGAALTQLSVGAGWLARTMLTRRRAGREPGPSTSETR